MDTDQIKTLIGYEGYRAFLSGERVFDLPDGGQVILQYEVAKGIFGERDWSLDNAGDSGAILNKTDLWSVGIIERTRRSTMHTQQERTLWLAAITAQRKAVALERAAHSGSGTTEIIEEAYVGWCRAEAAWRYLLAAMLRRGAPRIREVKYRVLQSDERASRCWDDLINW